jgi:hypothetical protein
VEPGHDGEIQFEALALTMFQSLHEARERWGRMQKTQDAIEKLRRLKVRIRVQREAVRAVQPQCYADPYARNVEKGLYWPLLTASHGRTSQDARLYTGLWTESIPPCQVRADSRMARQRDISWGFRIVL